MNQLIAACLHYSRTTLLLMTMVFVVGLGSYFAIPKESAPDVPIPLIYVSLHYDGIAPEDAVDLLIKPMEKELKTIQGLDELQAQAYQNGGSVTLKFTAGFDNKKALEDVRAKVDIAKAELPRSDNAEEPRIMEVNIATFPILTIILKGALPERVLQAVAEDLQDALESAPGVLEANLRGTREEMVLIDIDRNKLEAYQLDLGQLANVIQGNNALVAAGSLQTGTGEYAVKVPGLFKSREDILNLPLVSQGDKTIRVGDVADVRLGFKDQQVITRVDGQPAVAIEISKRIGENVIETVDAVKAVVSAAQANPAWPEGLSVRYTSDESNNIRAMLTDLQNNVIMSLILVMVTVVLLLGMRASLLIASTIPGSFLFASMCLYLMGYTMNIVVLFSLILAIGMVVDAAIVVTELAERKMTEGKNPRDAFREASVAMAWPVIASTLTILIVFIPLLFWPGIVGEFMKFVPITLILTLAGALLMTFTFIPVLGAYLGRPNLAPNPTEEKFSHAYGRLLSRLLRAPGRVVAVGTGAVVVTYIAFGVFGQGVIFFPSIEPERANLVVRAKGDYDVLTKDSIVAKVEQAALGAPGVATVYTTAGNLAQQQAGKAQDIIGTVFLEFTEWETGRPKAEKILADIIAQVGPLEGATVESESERAGPSQGRPIRLAVLGDSFAAVEPVARQLTTLLAAVPGTRSVSNSLPDPGIEWNVVINRDEAARVGTSLALVGGALQLGTTGMIVGKYRPDDQDEEIDIIARFDAAERRLNTLETLRVPTAQGMVPIGHLAEVKAQPKVTLIERLDQRTVAYVEADVQPGVLPNDVLAAFKTKTAAIDLPTDITIRPLGDEKEQQETATFLQVAFGIAVFGMLIVLVTQFNSLLQTGLVLTAIVLSTAGALAGFLLLQQPFGVVMGGLGMIVLAGTIVSNNIILIDTYNELRLKMDSLAALVETGKQRLRPIFLTVITTITGLIPLGMKLNIDLINRQIIYDAPSSQWWDQLSNTIMFGLFFGSILTLVITPCLIALCERWGWYGRGK